MDLKKQYELCAYLAERYLHRCKFFIIFLNLYLFTLVAYDTLKFKIVKLYKKWTTLGLSD